MVGSTLTKSFILLMVTKAVDSIENGKIHIHVYHDPKYITDGLKHFLKANLYAANNKKGHPPKNGNPLDKNKLPYLGREYLFPSKENVPMPPNGNHIPFNGPRFGGRRDGAFPRISSIINGSRNGMDGTRVGPTNSFSNGNFPSQNGNSIRSIMNMLNGNNGLSELQNLLINLLAENDRLRKSLNGMDSDDRDSRDRESFDDFLDRDESRRNGDDDRRRILNDIAGRTPLDRDSLIDELQTNGKRDDNGVDDSDDNRGIRPRSRSSDDISPEINGVSNTENNRVTPHRGLGDRPGANINLNGATSDLRGLDRSIPTLDIPEEDLRRYRIERYIQLNGNGGPMTNGNSVGILGRPNGRNGGIYDYRYHNLPYRFSGGNYYNRYYRYPFSTSTPEAGPYGDLYPMGHGVPYRHHRRSNGFGYRPSHFINPRLTPWAPDGSLPPSSPYDLYSPFSNSFGRRNGVYHGPNNHIHSIYKNYGLHRPYLNGGKGKGGRRKSLKKFRK